MKQLVASIVVVAVLAVPAAAERVALDYRADDPSCADATRFADEVSAKLGFVPWDASAGAKIRVRIAREGAGFMGSVLNTDGSSKIIDGETCAKVTSTLAVTVAGALDDHAAAPAAPPPAAPPPATPAEPPAAPADNKVAVTFVAADGRRVDVALATGGGIARASDGKVVASNYYESLCTSPCTARVQPGRLDLRFTEPETRSFGRQHLMLEGPAQITLHHNDRSGVRGGVFASGVFLTAASIAGGFLLGGDGGAALGLIGGTLGGVTMLVSPAFRDTFTATQAGK